MPSIEKSDILFVINPNAGKRNVHKIIHQLSAPENAIRYVVTHSFEEMDQVMKRELQQYKVFVAVGGDGTVSAISRHLIHTEKILAVYPGGSGNGFANEMGFKPDLKKLISQIVSGVTRDIDVLYINKKSFINMAGIGFDGEVIHRLQRLSKSGLLNYIFSSLQTFRNYKPVDMRISGEGINVEGKYFMVSLANTRQFGNMAIISPQSTPDDGLFEIICVKPLSFFNAVKHGIALFNGRIQESKELQYFTSGQSILIETAAKHFHLDGEPNTGDGKYEISIERKCLRVSAAESRGHRA